MKQDITSPRVAPYARISDSDEERAPGLDRQLRAVMPLIASRGGDPTHEYVDNDKSAFKEDVIRDEGFEPWLADFIAGKNDGIAAFDLDRLFRQPLDLERVIKAYCRAYRKQGRLKPALWLPAMSLDLTDEDGCAEVVSCGCLFCRKLSDQMVRATKLLMIDVITAAICLACGAALRRTVGEQ